MRALSANASFDVDHRVHVFEVTIRALGGLLSAHILIEEASRGQMHSRVVWSGGPGGLLPRTRLAGTM